ncbi:C39 family peptidase [Patescibacteria group bacterium]|nr:C39 family peptidase [Patescibacteria group bacterium]
MDRMQKRHKHGITLLLAGILTGVIGIAPWPQVPQAHADSTTSTTTLQSQLDANTAKVQALNQQIADYETQLTKIGADKKTLQDAINALTIQRNKVQAQISITQSQINITSIQIQQYSADIADTQQTIETDQQALAVYIRSLQKADEQSPLEQLLISGSLSDAWNNIDALIKIQGAIQNKVQTLQNLGTQLADSQTASKQKQATLSYQKQALINQQADLVANKSAKDQLLVQTNSQESKYQALLSEAKAQLASFSAFAANAGAKGLLLDQTNCDSWGCYYNQRDAAWGDQSLNGTKYTLADAGCLVTSMAMVMTHYGYRDVTPATIDADPNNFASYYPAYLLYTINVDGVTASRVGATINATLATGNPVILGLNVFGGTHFIVLTGRDANGYIMRDPYFINSKDVSFSSRYNLGEVFTVEKVVINKA